MLVSSLAAGYPMLVCAQLAMAYMANGAVGGTRIEQFSDRFPRTLASFGALTSTVVFVAEGGYNNIIAGQSAATAFAFWVQYIGLIRNAGYVKVVWLQMMSAVGSGLVPGDYETKRLAFNALVTASGLVDAEANFDGVVVPRNADLLHPNDAGELVMQPIVAAAVLAVL